MASGDLSVKGVLRKHLGLSPDLDVMRDAYPFPIPLVEHSLRDLLEASAATEHNFKRRDNCLSNRVKYQQTWTHIRVRVELNPVNQDAQDAMAAKNLRTTWRTGIESTWNNNWSCRRLGELACRLSFEIDYVDKDSHYKVKVDDDAGRTNYLRWDVFDSASVIAHEFGHMIGHFDEYTDPDCVERDPVNTGSVMDNNSPNVPERLMTLFSQHLGGEVTDADGNFLKPF